MYCLMWPDVLGQVLIGLVVMLFTFLFFFYLWRTRNLPPGPWGLPILGFLPWIDSTKPYQTFIDLTNDYGSIYSLRMGELIVVVLSHPTFVKDVLSKEIFAGRAPLWLTHGIMKNQGLISVEGEKWREQRKFVASSLKSLGAVRIGGNRDSMEKKILQSLKDTLELIDSTSHEGPFDPREVLLHTIGNLVNFITFGMKFERDDETWKTLLKLSEEGAKMFGVAGILNFIPLLRFLPKYSDMMKFIMDGMVWTHEVYRQIAEEKKTPEDNVMSLYLQAIDQRKGRYFTQTQMYHVVGEIFGAGVDTTLATVRWFLLFMALHPEYQEKAQREIDEALGSRNLPNLDDIHQCRYTEAAILETMRIRPVVPLGIPHGTLGETEIAGYRIPAGTMIMINQWALCHDPGFWNDPDSFNPKRFIKPDGSILRTDYLNPFQNGKRVCIGEEMAKMIIFLFAMGILRNYKLEIVGDAAVALEGVCGITMNPGEHEIKFIRRITA